MNLWNKIKIMSLVIVLVIAYSHPPAGTDQAIAQSDVEEFDGFILTVDKISGRINLLGLRPGIILDTQVSFTSAQAYGLSLSKLVDTDYGTMVLTIESSTPEERVDVSWMDVTANSLNIGGLCWPERILDVCLEDIVIDASELSSSAAGLPNLTMRTSFDPEDVAEVEAQQQRLEDQDDEEQLETLINAIDEAEDGELTNEIDNVSDLQTDMGELSELIGTAQDEKQETEEKMNSLEEMVDEADEWADEDDFDEMKENMDQQHDDVTTVSEDFSTTLEQVDEQLQHVQAGLESLQEDVESRHEYLEELTLDGWSERYEELMEMDSDLNAVEEGVQEVSEQVKILHDQEESLKERLDTLREQMDDIDFAPEEDPEEESEPEEDNTEGQDEAGHDNGEMESLESELTELLQDMKDTEEELTELEDTFKAEWIDPVEEALDDSLDEEKLDEWQGVTDEAKQDDRFETGVTDLYEIEEMLNEYESEIEDHDKKREEYENDDHIDVEVYDIDDQLTAAAEKHEDMQGRIDDIEETLEELFDEAEERLQEEKERIMTNETRDEDDESFLEMVEAIHEDVESLSDAFEDRKESEG